MEQNNIEKYIKEVIDGRSIEPTNEARKRLITALNSKSRKKRKIWLSYGAAAAVAFILLFTGIRLFENNKENSIQVIEQNDTPEIRLQKSSLSTDQNTSIVSEDQVESDISTKTLNRPKITSKTNRIALQKHDYNDENQINANSNVETNHSFESEKQNIMTVENEAMTLNAIAQLDTVKNESLSQFMYITPEDLLLATVSDSSPQLIETKKKVSKTYVQPDYLLVEMERQLFDEKNKSIFTKAKRKLKKIKEAVANRNYKQ